MSHISLRSDPEIEAAFAELGVRDGERTATIKAAIIALAAQHRLDRLTAEAAQLAADPAEQAEANRVLEQMSQLRAW